MILVVLQKSRIQTWGESQILYFVTEISVRCMKSENCTFLLRADETNQLSTLSFEYLSRQILLFCHKVSSFFFIYSRTNLLTGSERSPSFDHIFLGFSFSRQRWHIFPVHVTRVLLVDAETVEL